MGEQLTISDLHKILGKLIEKGHGDKEFQLFYDSEYVYTSIPKDSPIRIFEDGVRFTDYEYKRSCKEMIEISPMSWQKCTFQVYKHQRLYCQLKQKWCNSKDCKEQMI